MRSGSINNAAIEINSIDSPKAVILSHWDLDHILGVTETNDSIYEAVWIAPNFFEGYSQVSLSAQRLCAFLVLKGTQVLMLDESFDSTNVISINKSISLFKGKGMSSHGINKANNYGLILQIKSLNTGEAILLPGDCEYETMPNEVFDTSYKYIVVSHHCSKMSPPKFLAPPPESLAIISVGINSHGHPNEHHKCLLKRKGYSIRETRNLKFPISKIEINI